MFDIQRKLYVLMTLVMAMTIHAKQRPNSVDSISVDAIHAVPKYDIVLSQVIDPEEVIQRNGKLGEEATKGLFADALGAALKMSYGSFVQQKAANMAENIVNYTIQFIVSSIEERKNRFRNWFIAANNRCHFSKTISQSQVYDFYALPSLKGAFDYDNIKFKGFGFRSSLSLPNQSDTVSCYIYCSFREDQEAMTNIVNHGKFLVQIDTVLINTHWFDLPNDSVIKDVDENFFLRHKDLSVTLTAKFFSSWFNEAIMLQDERELGEFTATIQVDSTYCQDGVFSYIRGENDQEVGTVVGECFIVPRSYCGIILSNGVEQPTWGTGQYRVEMTLKEDCQLNHAYYIDSIAMASDRNANLQMTAQQEMSSGQYISMVKIPEQKLYDKAKWMTEWTQMQAIHKDKKKSGWHNYWSGLWREVVSVAKGSHWVTTYTEPFMKAYINTQSGFINKELGLTPTVSEASDSNKKTK